MAAQIEKSTLVLREQRMPHLFLQLRQSCLKIDAENTFLGMMDAPCA